MKLTFALSALAALASAIPIEESMPLEARQLSITRNDLEQGDSGNCPKAILIFARGSTEAGNMVRLERRRSVDLF